MGVETDGTKIVSDPPMIITPEDETTTRPSGSVMVMAEGGPDVELPPELGKNVKVSEFHVVVIGVVSPVGTVNVLPSRLIRPLEDTTTRPSGSVKVVASCPALAWEEDPLEAVPFPEDVLLDVDPMPEDELCPVEVPPLEVVPFPEDVLLDVDDPRPEDDPWSLEVPLLEYEPVPVDVSFTPAPKFFRISTESL